MPQLLQTTPTYVRICIHLPSSVLHVWLTPQQLHEGKTYAVVAYVLWQGWCNGVRAAPRKKQTPSTSRAWLAEASSRPAPVEVGSPPTSESCHWEPAQLLLRLCHAGLLDLSTKGRLHECAWKNARCPQACALSCCCGLGLQAAQFRGTRGDVGQSPWTAACLATVRPTQGRKALKFTAKQLFAV